RDALHQQGPNIPNHGSQPVFPLKSVATANRNGLLAQAGIQPADNFVLAEQLHHGLFHGAVEAHVVIEIQVLLGGYLVFAHRFPRGTRSCSGFWPLGSFSNTSGARAGSVSKPNTSPKCCVSAAAAWLRLTSRASNFSSEVTRQPAIPQGTIKSK